MGKTAAHYYKAGKVWSAVDFEIVIKNPLLALYVCIATMHGIFLDYFYCLINVDNICFLIYTHTYNTACVMSGRRQYRSTPSCLSPPPIHKKNKEEIHSGKFNHFSLSPTKMFICI